MSTFQTIAGAVNGIPTTRGVRTDGPDLQTINIADNGSATTLDVNTDGNPPDEAAVSSRVCIIGGTTSGRDHFPLVVPDYAPNSIFPISIPFAEAILTVWRIRKWRVHGSLSNTRNGATATFDWIATIGDDKDRAIGDQGSDITVEGQLVVGPYMDSIDALNDPAGGIYEVEMLLGDSLVFENPAFRPYLAVRVFSTSAIDCVMDSRPGLAGGGGTATSVDAYLNIAGTHRTFTMYKNSSETGTITGSIAIEPNEYWPYAAKDGSPIYDTSTGAQLQNPLN